MAGEVWGLEEEIEWYAKQLKAAQDQREELAEALREIDYLTVDVKDEDRCTEDVMIRDIICAVLAKLDKIRNL